MPQIPIIMPQLGESIAEATIINFLFKPGDQVEADQDLIEVETDKATMSVTSPCSGRVENFVAQLNESCAVGGVLGYLEVTPEEAARAGLDARPVRVPDEELPETTSTGAAAGGAIKKTVQPSVRGLPVPANAAGASFMSPRMK